MISWSRVEELREEIGDEDFSEVSQMFLEEVEEVIARLKKNPNPASLEEDLHSLKGSALNLGFEALSNLCQDGEMKAARAEFDAISLPDVFETYARSKAEFSARVPLTPRPEAGGLDLF